MNTEGGRKKTNLYFLIATILLGFLFVLVFLYRSQLMGLFGLAEANPTNGGFPVGYNTESNNVDAKNEFIQYYNNFISPADPNEAQYVTDLANLLNNQEATYQDLYDGAIKYTASFQSLKEHYNKANVQAPEIRKLNDLCLQRYDVMLSALNKLSQGAQDGNLDTIQNSMNEIYKYVDLRKQWISEVERLIKKYNLEITNNPNPLNLF